MPARASISLARARVTALTSRGPSPLERLDRFVDLEGVADGTAERMIHAGQQSHRFYSGVVADLDHRLGQAGEPGPVRS